MKNTIILKDDSGNKAKFKIGQIIHHRLFDYTGVVLDIDPYQEKFPLIYVPDSTSIMV